ncbi:MAG TPA: hypothetical protein ENN80_05990 [Candidatus Hydrogenedentes bacterium]|nr:hypothetical protein [Candidatus Hydrogenedentota bacterium]
MPLITLTTDFGERDPYVAAMKGVLYRECPGVTVADLSHAIAPQDVMEGALFMAGAAAYFPEDTVHVAVVDPGVGTQRRPIAVSAGGQRFVCPDNGLLTLWLRTNALDAARVITNPDFMCHPLSATFHGRDLFAPAAACLARGELFETVGEDAGELVALDVSEAAWVADHVLSGEIIHLDRFGNAVTNIPRQMLRNLCVECVQAGEHRFKGLSATYSDVEEGAPVVLFSSTDYLEIALRNGNAAQTLRLERGMPLAVTCTAA